MINLNEIAFIDEDGLKRKETSGIVNKLPFMEFTRISVL